MELFILGLLIFSIGLTIFVSRRVASKRMRSSIIATVTLLALIIYIDLAVGLFSLPWSGS